MKYYVWEIKFTWTGEAQRVEATGNVYIIDQTLDGALNKLAGLKRDRNKVIGVQRMQEVTGHGV
jgi:hypothetical protein